MSRPDDRLAPRPDDDLPPRRPEDRLAPRPDDERAQPLDDDRRPYPDDDRRPRRRDRDYPPPRKSNTLMIVLLILGGFVVVGGIVAALLFPAYSKVRSAAARAQSQNNLKQIGVGVHFSTQMNGNRAPPSVGQYPANGPNGSLFFHLLPHVEQEFIYQQYRMQPTRVPDSMVVKDYVAPGDETNTSSSALTSYASNAALFGLTDGGTPRFFERMVKGSSSTIMFTERYAVAGGKRHTWYGVGDRDNYLYPPTNPGIDPDKSEFTPPQFDVKPEKANPNAPHAFAAEIICVSFGDGSVRSFPQKEMTAHTWAWACSVNGPLSDEMPPPGW